MKVLGIMGSPRVGGNSDILLDDALAGAKDAGAQVEKIILDKKKISGCKDCRKCNSVPVYFWSMTAQMKAYLDRWCALFDADWSWQKAYYPRMKGKRIGLITVCGDPNVHTADPVVHSFKSTADMTKMHWLGAVMASATVKGDILKDETARKKAFELGKKAATP